jgi:hypothetical protein
MYTPEMATAFKSIVPPKNFGLTILENPDFITLQVEPKDLIDLSEDGKQEIVKYINDVKLALENLDARIYVVRKPLEE